MTDRVHSLTVVLDKDIRIDDIEPLIDAIKLFNHVIEVSPNISDPNAFMAETRVKRKLVDKLFKVLQE